MKTTHLEDAPVNIKIKLAALWTATTFCYLYGDYFELYTPDKLNSMINGNNPLSSSSGLLFASLIMAVPPIMIVVSIFLKPKLNKWLNIIFGGLFTLLMLSIAIESLKPWYAFYVFLALLDAVLTGLAVWLALKWPRTA